MGVAGISSLLGRRYRTIGRIWTLDAPQSASRCQPQALEKYPDRSGTGYNHHRINSTFRDAVSPPDFHGIDPGHVCNSHRTSVIAAGSRHGNWDLDRRQVVKAEKREKHSPYDHPWNDYSDRDDGDAASGRLRNTRLGDSGYSQRKRPRPRSDNSAPALCDNWQS